MISNNKIPQIIEKIKSAGVPERFSIEFLRKLGFPSSNDRAFLPLFKKLGFLSQDGTPTEYYSQLKNPKEADYVLADRIRELYADLFSLDTNINSAPDAEIRGAIARVTGKDEATVTRYFSTFKSFVPLANFEKQSVNAPLVRNSEEEKGEAPKAQKQPYIKQEMVDFHYNIQIHLPATTDINIYNAIFKSIKDNLVDQ